MESSNFWSKQSESLWAKHLEFFAIVYKKLRTFESISNYNKKNGIAFCAVVQHALISRFC